MVSGRVTRGMRQQRPLITLSGCPSAPRACCAQPVFRSPPVHLTPGGNMDRPGDTRAAGKLRVSHVPVNNGRGLVGCEYSRSGPGVRVQRWWHLCRPNAELIPARCCAPLRRRRAPRVSPRMCQSRYGPGRRHWTARRARNLKAQAEPGGDMSGNPRRASEIHRHLEQAPHGRFLRRRWGHAARRMWHKGSHVGIPGGGSPSRRRVRIMQSDGPGTHLGGGLPPGPL